MNISSEPLPLNAKFRPRTDPITFEVLRHRLWQINREQGQTLVNMSGSQIATEANDFNVAIADSRGNLIIVGPYILVQVAPLTLLIQSAIRTLGNGVADGDMYLCNDPWLGAVHQNDVCVLAPFFFGGKLIAWIASVIHQVDVGGGAPGSWCHEAVETFQEAPRYRFLKVARGGQVQQEVVDTYLTNSRTPDLLDLDLRAQIGSGHATRQRLKTLFDRYGEHTITATMEDMLDYSERLFAHKLASIPNGEWLGECYLDHDGRQESSHRYAVALRHDDAGLTFDYSRTDSQLPAFINSPFCGLFSATLVGVLGYLCGDIPWNSGIMRRVKIVAREGALNNANFPAPVSGSLESIWNSLNAASVALGKMLTCSEEQRDSAMAVWQGSTLVFSLFGTNQHGDRYGGWILCSSLGGGGARTFGDGHDNSGPIVCPCYSTINVENAEHLYPMLYLYRKRAADSGGPGAWRGGVSAESAVTPYGTSEMTVRLTSSGSDHSHTEGLCGGYPGGGSVARIARQALPLKYGSEIPAEWTAIRSTKEELLPAKAVFKLMLGDVFSTIPHGGGGYGDPIERDVNLVRRDVADGCVSEGRAASLYGVVLRDSTIDHSATAERRNQIRLERAGMRATDDVNVGAGRPADLSTLAGVARANGLWVCAGCGYKLGALRDNVKERCNKHSRPVGAAGPFVAMRTAGDSTTLHLLEYSCPQCARLLFVDDRPKGEEGCWHDFKFV